MLNEFIEKLRHAFVLLLPADVVFPGLLGKNQLHSASFRSLPSPACKASMAASRRFALAGLRSR